MNTFIAGVHANASAIFKEFGLKIMPSVSVVEEIIKILDKSIFV